MVYLKEMMVNSLCGPGCVERAFFSRAEENSRVPCLSLEVHPQGLCISDLPGLVYTVSLFSEKNSPC